MILIIYKCFITGCQLIINSYDPLENYRGSKIPVLTPNIEKIWKPACARREFRTPGQELPTGFRGTLKRYWSCAWELFMKALGKRAEISAVEISTQ
ncbi:Uncharacterised protein [uncultured archaeon]|nr:Uncharacterised protein [uncultured archaeon]